MLEASTVGRPAPMRGHQVASDHDPVGTERPFVQPAARRQQPGEGLLHDVVDRVGVADAGRDDASDQCGQLGDVHPVPTRSLDVPQHPRVSLVPTPAVPKASPMGDYRRRDVMRRRLERFYGRRPMRRSRRHAVTQRAERNAHDSSTPSTPALAPCRSTSAPTEWAIRSLSATDAGTHAQHPDELVDQFRSRRGPSRSLSEVRPLRRGSMERGTADPSGRSP